MGLFDLFKKKNSGDVAKDRLKLLLVSDRANLMAWNLSRTISLMLYQNI